jgi:glycerol-3-phosphate acyltransferase PlsY
MELFILILLLIGAYLLGSFPTAYLVVKRAIGKDIRQQETGNVGAMNTARSTGKWYLFLLVFVVDALKGYIAVMFYKTFEWQTIDTTIVISLLAAAVVLGHCYSIFFKIKDGKFAGGKAISSLAGILIAVSFPLLFVPLGIIMLLVVIATRNFFASQFFGALSLPLIGLIFYPEYFLMTILVAIPILIKQSPRIKPLFAGKEPLMYFRKVKS